MIVSCEISPEEVKVFMEEAEEHIQLLDEDLVKLENEGDNQELLQEIFRSAHTLKGSSAMLGHERMAEVTHAMESLLDKLRNRKIAVSSRVIDALLFGLDALKVLKDEVRTGQESDLDVATIVKQLNDAAGSTKKDGALMNNGRPASDRKRGRPLELNKAGQKKVDDAVKKGELAYTVRVFFDPASEWLAVRTLQVNNDLASMGEVIASRPTLAEIEQGSVDGDYTAIVCCLRKADEIENMLKLIGDVVRVSVAPYGTAQARSLIKPGTADDISGAALPENREEKKSDLKVPASQIRSESLNSIRVDVKVLDSLMNMVEELVIDRSRISQVGRLLEGKYPDDELVGDLGDTSNHIIKVINELYQDIMKVRMVPISLVFNKFPRLVRDLAQKQQKNLDFVIKGEGTELDRTIIEKIQDPLVHLLRNAVDHGVESPGERRAKGKPERALIRLEAYHEEGHIVIRLEDDGRGIDPKKVREAAVRKGFISAESAAKMSDSEAIDLIFASGMSTAERTTEVSGRGVGLDIVRTNIERLNGTITLETRVDRGTTFILKLPLTVAVFQGLVVTVSGASYIVPLVSVVETIKIRKRDIKTVRMREVLVLRDTIVPLMRMSRVLGLGQESVDRNEEYVLVVRAGDRVAGIVVDELKEQMEFVIKSLGKYLGELKGIAGATILGDGTVALILDVPTLIRMFAQQGQQGS